MEIERETVVQVVLASLAVALFIAALVGISLAYGTAGVVEQSVSGTLDGDLEDIDHDDGVTTAYLEGEFDGELLDADGEPDGSIEGDVEGELTGELQGDTFTGEFNGTISGAVDGDLAGDVEGTFDEDAGVFDGELAGDVDGTTGTTISPEGGLVLVGLLALYILFMPIVGYLIERQERDSED